MDADNSAFSGAISSPLTDSPVGSLTVPAMQATEGKGIWLSIVLPTYNECKNIAAMVDRLSKVLDTSRERSYEIIVVDDDSPDGTWRVAAGLMVQHPCLRVVRRCGERGLSSAVIRGWQVARGNTWA